MQRPSGRLSSIDLVPEHAQDEIVWAIGELNQRQRTQADILFELNDRLVTKGVEPISSSAFNRKALKLRAAQIRLAEARHIFTGIADQFTPEKVDENSIVLGEFIKMLVFELAQADAQSPKGAMELARAFHDTIKGQAMSSARRSKLDEDYKKRTAGALVAVASKAGLSKERVAELRDEFLNLAEKPK